MENFALPQKIVPALRRLFRYYNKKDEKLLQVIIENAHIYVESGVTYDSWNGGTYGHDIYIFVASNIIDLVDLEKQDQVHKQLHEDLCKASPRIENEFINSVFIQETDERDSQYQAAMPFSKEPKARPDDVGLWKDNTLRLFVSHRDQHKAVAWELAKSLEPYGISAFVAHDAIKPMKEWQQEIMNGLMTMEVMLVLLTDDFHESEWTNQEVGYALGKGVPIICVKVGSVDPLGFIAPRQALKASYESIFDAAPIIQKALIDEIGQESRLKEVLIGAFINSNSYIAAMDSLKRLTEVTDRLTDSEFVRIVNGYKENDQLHTCAGIHNRNNWFKRYLEGATGKELIFEGNEITEVKQDILDKLPF
ncbi:MAG: toll/interleukin-1 receptor domain-containing protein [Candidatus Thiodiazotropha taylori]